MTSSSALVLAAGATLGAASLAQALGSIPGLSSPSNALTFSIGGYSLQGYATPEQFDQIGGSQVIEAHDFPGGTRTIQTYGAFADPMVFKGLLMGTSAFDVAQSLDRMRVSAQLISVTYAQFTYSGIISKFYARPKHQWHVPYELHFMPVADQSGAVSPPSDVDLLSAEVVAQVSTLSDLYLGEAANLFALPAALMGPVANLITVTNTGLLNANGNIANLDASDEAVILASINELQAAANPLISSTDPSQSSPALDSLMSANAIQIAIGATTAPKWQVQVINPNLYSLAAQYYGDATQWRTIANVNNLTDPQPIGNFNLQIPPTAASS